MPSRAGLLRSASPGSASGWAARRRDLSHAGLAAGGEGGLRPLGRHLRLPTDPRRAARVRSAGIGQRHHEADSRTRPGRPRQTPKAPAPPGRANGLPLRTWWAVRFTARAPDVLWCGDMTGIATGEGKLCPATVLDLHSRRLLGHTMDAHHDAEPLAAALQMAAAARGGTVADVVFHSDRDSEEYTSKLFSDACGRLGAAHSTRRVGSALDNAAAGALNSTIKVEYVHRHRFRTRRVPGPVCSPPLRAALHDD
ncbi:DDE-type integrase/transposase/recombinase [Streptomyces olivoreticuli]|uniref:DDE-type integrase/transposase/recombinase n=1 Tax=Streptomyces olivoreticuli TaxID=68246 RepID=UPI0026597230|nr:DDE-type integrase/transposase/recombinase [Streptomyces olivoreticuli]WKK24204.1 DDE-type integrase/transposase/recombinase [Streptomyces olivoreticuli]